MMIEPETLTLATSDGYPVVALRYPAIAPLRGHLIVAGATGVAQGFYRHFAQFAAERGYTTLTLDYRGIGLSKPERLRGFDMNYLDWAQIDLTSAVQAMSLADVPLFMVGHSYGGHAFGLLPNVDKVARFYTFATGAGWHGWMPWLESLKVRVLWNLVAPFVVRQHGYLAWSRLRMGEDLPLGVYRDWKHWCNFPRYFFDDPQMPQVQALFDRVHTPMIAANAIDDLWALPASRDAFMAGYRQARWQGVDIDPKVHGLASIGHMGYFRRNAQALWHPVLDWFDEHQARDNRPHAAYVS